MSKPYGVVSDQHAHNWNTFSHTLASGENSRLRIILDELLRAAQEVKDKGGDLLIDAGDVHMFIRLPKRPAPTLAERLRAAGYGAKTVPVILRNLKEGIRGNIAHPSDRQMYRNLRKQGLSPASANAVVKSTRKKNP